MTISKSADRSASQQHQSPPTLFSWLNQHATTALFVIMSLVYLSSVHLTPYEWQFAVKGLPILLLIAVCIRSLSGKDKLWMTTALSFSLAGDIFLALPIANSFVFGLGSFLVAQCCYAIYFFTLKRDSSVAITNRVCIIAIIGFGCAMAIHLLPKTGVLLIPVTIYLCAISAMAVMAFYRDVHLWTKIGVMSFLASDAILAQSLFAQALPYSSLWVMSTYYIAQFFILHGIILQRQSNT